MSESNSLLPHCRRILVWVEAGLARFSAIKRKTPKENPHTDAVLNSALAKAFSCQPGDKILQRWLELVVDSDKNLRCTFRAAFCSGEGLDAPTKVNTLLSLCECHKCHFQPLNVKEAVEVTANTADRRDTLVPISNIPERCFFLYISKKKNHPVPRGK